MPEALKHHFGREIPRRIAEMIRAVHPPFRSAEFLRAVAIGYEDLELTPRGWHIARTLRRFLPDGYPEAVEILLASLGPKLQSTENNGMAPFLYLPHVLFVAEYGVGHFDHSMRAQHALTQRFSAEFSIRAFLQAHPERTLRVLREWAADASVHVRRLVSEGTRPRLPWAPRLREFQRNPAPVLELLDLLKDDPELYVRRSVANNLNDIGKDHPGVLTDTCRRWLEGAGENRRWLIRHALRSAVKRGDAAALELLGFGGKVRVALEHATVTPKRVRMGGEVKVSVSLRGTAARAQRVLVDFRVHFVKSSGVSAPKVFKLKELDLAPGEMTTIGKSVSLRDMTTRKHYPGLHRVDILINGQAHPAGEFRLLPRAKSGRS